RGDNIRKGNSRMPERQSTPGATTTEQDAEAAARGAAADNASSRPASPDEPTRPVTRDGSAHEPTRSAGRGDATASAPTRPVGRGDAVAFEPTRPVSRGDAAAFEPTRSVSRGDAATVGSARAVVPTPPVEGRAARSPRGPVARRLDDARSRAVPPGPGSCGRPPGAGSDGQPHYFRATAYRR